MAFLPWKLWLAKFLLSAGLDFARWLVRARCAFCDHGNDQSEWVIGQATPDTLIIHLSVQLEPQAYQILKWYPSWLPRFLNRREHIRNPCWIPLQSVFGCPLLPEFSFMPIS